MSDALDLPVALERLERRLDAALAAALPNAYAFTFSESVVGYQAKRDVVYACGILNEGENEAALILGFIHDRRAQDPTAPIDHLTREAWYYLRTSTDPSWQIDPAGPSLPVIVAFLDEMLAERTARLHAGPPPRAIAADDDQAARNARLRELRARR
jgi:hypothetical protein